jgi:DNA-binding transcriptional LysR family regulator
MNEQDCLLMRYLDEERNLTRTAERLYITQPALTYRLQQIEKEFGVSIIVKDKRGIRLTPEGEYLVTYAEQTLHNLRKVKDFIVNMRDVKRGTLRIGVSSYFALYKLPPLLRDFKALYPNIEIHVTTGMSNELIDGLLADELHVGIIRGNYHWYEKKYFMEDENICIIARDPIHLKDLPLMPRVNYREPTTSVQAKSSSHTTFVHSIDQWWKDHYDQPPYITMDVDSYETCRELVRNGLGYAIVPRIFIHKDDDLYTYDLVGKDNEPLKRTTWMLYKKDLEHLKIVHLFVEFVQASYPQNHKRT